MTASSSGKFALLAGLCATVVGIVHAASAPDASNHWAFHRPVEPAIPAVKNAAWVQQPIDAFIAARLEANGLSPAKPADKRTLIRRAYFDLIGLPPTVEQVQAFIADHSPDAFAKVVDRLLADPHYGERWGRYWLDVARYSDTKGYVFTEERRYAYAYTYRDYVIRSFNEDKPYDRFVLEQVAADLLPPGDDKRNLAAMGFITLGRRFINVKPDIMDDRMDVVCRGMMGLTIGCARCHNHKFDPIPTADYYSLYSIFNNSPEPKEPPQIGEPEDPVAYAEFRKHLDLLQGDMDAYIAKMRQELVEPMKSADKIAEYMLDAHHGKFDQGTFLQGKGPSPYVVSRWRRYLAERENERDTIFAAWRAYARLPEQDFAGKAAAATEKLAALDVKHLNPIVAKAFIGNPPASLDEVAARYGKLLEAHGATAGTSDPDELALRQLLDGPNSPLAIGADDIDKLFTREKSDHLTKLRNKIEKFRASDPNAPPRAMVLEDSKTLEPQHVFVRGNPGNRGDEVKPHFLTCIAGPNPAVFTKGSGRLELAQAIASKDNPLTARVLVNRVWLHHFGFGIVRTPSDFGTRCDPPTHPELLDYLAVNFMKEGWSIKKLHRSIMLSATYQMSSETSDDASRRDAQNLLLSHFNRQRLDFESTRDSLLFVGGKMDEKLYGRSVDITAEPFTERRSIYAYIDRQNLPGMFRNFDFASPDTTCARRFVTTVPQQALFMMNSPILIEQAKNVLDRDAIKTVAETRSKIVRLYQLLFNRDPSSDEITLGAAYVASEEQQTHDAVAWQYGFGEFDETANRLKSFTPVTVFTGTTWQGGKKLPDPGTGYVMLNARGGHAGNDLAHATIRRWTAPLDGVIKISGALGHTGKTGDGVHGRIVSNRLGELASWNVFQNEAQTDLDSVQVKRGDTIDFMVDCRKSVTSDTFTWAPTIRVAEVPGAAGTDAPEEWNAATNFGGPEKETKSLTPWEKYVQALMESNEFVFVD